jgi:hypothetical protein
MFPPWLRQIFSSPGVTVDLDKIYFGDNENLFVVDNPLDTFSRINPETTGIGYIFKTSMRVESLEETLEQLFGKIFDINVEAVTGVHYKVLNDRRNFCQHIRIVKGYFELRKFALWDTASKIPALFFVLTLLSLFDYDNCFHPEILMDRGDSNTRGLSLGNIFEISMDYTETSCITRPEITFHKGITKFFRMSRESNFIPTNSIFRDLEGVEFMLKSRETFQDSVRGLPLNPVTLTESILLQYRNLRRKF